LKDGLDMFRTSVEAGGCEWIGRGIAFSAVANTNKQRLNLNPDAAAKYCEDLVEAGHGDWLMPSKDDLVQLARFKPGDYLQRLSATAEPFWLWSADVNQTPAGRVRVLFGAVDTAVGTATDLAPVICKRMLY